MATDFFGEETDPFAPTGVKAPVTKTPTAPAPAPSAPSGYVGGKTASGGATGDAAAQQQAYQSGNIGGASGAYNQASEQGKAEYDYMHDLGSPGALGSAQDLLNAGGEQVGVSRAGDVTGAGWGGFDIKSPLDINPLAPVVDTQTGLGVSGTGAPVAATAPGAAALVGGTTPGDALTAALGGLGGAGGQTFDASGADRGGMSIDTTAALGRTGGAADAARALGADVLAGKTLPGGAGAAQQQDVLDQVLGFARAPEGPSKAQLLLQEANQGAMADVLAAARSGRARDAGSQARAMNVAQGEIAGMGVDAARNAGLLRAQEAQDFRNQQLQALGLGGDISGAIRGAGIQERGQTLDFTQGQQQIGAGLEGDLLKAIPQLEQVRHEDQFDLTPQQKLLAAQMGGARDPTTTDYVMGLLGDLLPVVGGAL